MKPQTQATEGKADDATPWGVRLVSGTDSLLPLGVALDEPTRLAWAGIRAGLVEPFPEAEIEWLLREDDVVRTGDKCVGRCFAYVTARAVEQRLDDIFGPFWSTRMQPTNFNTASRAGMICELSIFLPGIGWLTKTDAADLSSIDPVRGGASGALKRVAVQWGVGRYLYYLPKAHARFHNEGTHRIRVEGHELRWDPPLLPPEALPVAERPAREKLLRDRAAADAAARTSAAKQLEDAQKTAAAAAEAAAKNTPPAQPVAAVIGAPPAPAAGQTAAADPNANAAAVKPPAQDADPKPRTAPMPPSSVKNAAATGLTADMIQWLRATFGENETLSVAYLKHKGLLPSGATALLQIPASNAQALRDNAGRVASKMKQVFAVGKIVAGRDAAATTYFVGRNMVRSDQPWYAASDESLDKAISASEGFSRLLMKLTLNRSAQENKAA